MGRRIPRAIISRSNDGHFYLDAIINDRKIKFLIDTGASDLALSKKDALSLKIDLSKLKYTKTYHTANGSIAAAPLLLKKLIIGSKAFYNIEGNIGSGELEISLLGMGLINSFQSFKIDKDMLIITP